MNDIGSDSQLSPGLRVTIRIVGFSNLVLAMLGTYYMVGTVFRVYTFVDPFPYDPGKPYEATAFVVMTSINALFLAALLWNGLRLLRLEARAVLVGKWLFALEILYDLAIGASWALLPEKLRGSIASVSGIADMGLAPSILTGHPLIGLIALVLVARRLHSTRSGEVGHQTKAVGDKA